ncbi:hypothetical protein D3C74_397940 [compost metagenome]
MNKKALELRTASIFPLLSELKMKMNGRIRDSPNVGYTLSLKSRSLRIIDQVKRKNMASSLLRQTISDNRRGRRPLPCPPAPCSASFCRLRSNSGISLI